MISALLLAATAAAAAPDAESLGRELAAAAARGGARTVAVAAFAAPGGAPAGLGREASDSVLRGIVGSGRVRALERERLGAVMSEARLASAGAVAERAEPPALAAGDAVVVGRLERSARGWSLAARVVAERSGEVLGAGRADLPAEDASAPAEPDGFPPIGALVDAAHGLAQTTDAPRLAALADDAAAAPADRAAAVIALAEDGAGEELVLADALRDREPLVRFAAALALRRARAPWAAGPLRAALREDPSWLPRFAAAWALARDPSPAAEKDLIAARDADPSWRVRRQAAESLADRRAEAR